MRDRCLNCNGYIQLIDTGLGRRWLHIDPDADQSEKVIGWRHCHEKVASPTTTHDGSVR